MEMDVGDGFRWNSSQTDKLKGFKTPHILGSQSIIMSTEQYSLFGLAVRNKSEFK